MSTMLLAVGGNSLIREGEIGTIAEQRANVRKTAVEIVGLIRAGYRLVLTHGNGPQVGAALLRSERGASQVPGHPLDVCGASTQGEIGYLLQQALVTEIQRAGLTQPVATVVTQSVISPDDPAMKHPTKPIGPFYSLPDIEQRRRQYGWEIVEDASRGYRRVVPSPEPIGVVELDTIRSLFRAGVLVIACGGGGIPVAKTCTGLQGIEAVIDKDLASSWLAGELGVDLFVISTDTDRVYLDYRKPGQRALDRVCTAELEIYQKAGHFPQGNMGPKIEAVLRFLRHGGREAIISSCDDLCRAVEGRAGTHIVSTATGTDSDSKKEELHLLVEQS